MSNTIKCNICDMTFTKKRNFTRHMKHRPERCKLIEIKLQDQAKKIEEKVMKKMLLQIQEIEQEHKTVVNQLIRYTPTIKERKKFVDNLNARNKIQNFEKVIPSAKLQIEQLRNCLKIGAKGDLIIFKDLFIKDIPPNSRCIRVRDFAREKYQYFDGSEWIMTTLQHIIETIMRQLCKWYRLVMKEKEAELENIDKMYPGWFGNQKNMIEFNRVTDKYSDESTHFAQLNAIESSLYRNIKMGVKSMLSAKKN